jgi:glycosyltransferase involved in cell wall biosynthesis
MHYICYGRQGKLLQAPVRYLVQAWQTWRVLRWERPDVVLVQNPPIFCALVAFLYARRYSAQYIIDSHTGAFLSRKWRWSLGLHRMLSRGALVTIVHNTHQEEIVRRWGCPYCVLAFVPGDYPAGEPFPLNGPFNVAVISSFLSDEPVDVILEAASRLPEARFYLTGDSKRIAPRLLAEKPDNCCLTGYLPDEQYVGLLRSVDAVMTLTTSDHTLLMAAFEAVSLGKPLITSDWSILQNYFYQGTVHVSNTVEGVCEGVRQARRAQETLQKDILGLREQLLAEWKQGFLKLQHLIGGD